MNTITDLQKPDKILLDNSNLLYTLSDKEPEIGTVRETFFGNQLHSAGHLVEYGGMKSGDFRIDGDWVIEVGGHDKTLRQVKEEAKGYVAADESEMMIPIKPLQPQNAPVSISVIESGIRT